MLHQNSSLRAELSGFHLRQDIGLDPVDETIELFLRGEFACVQCSESAGYVFHLRG